MPVKDLITTTYQYLIDENIDVNSVVNLFAFEAACHLNHNRQYLQLKNKYQIQTMASYYEDLIATTETLVTRMKQQNIYQGPKVIDLNIFKEERHLMALQLKYEKHQNQYALLSVFRNPGYNETVLTYQRLLDILKIDTKKD